MALTNQDINKLSEVFATKHDLRESLDSFQEEIKSKLNEIVGTLSDVMKEIKDDREERTLISHKLSDHDDRISKLESKFVQ